MQANQPQGIHSAEEAAEHENMKAVLKSSLRVGDSGTSTVPGLRTRTRAGNSRGKSTPSASCYQRRSEFYGVHSHAEFVVLVRVAPWCPASEDLVNGADDTADEIMERIVRSATQGPSQRTQPRERRRSRVNRKSRKTGWQVSSEQSLAT